MEDDFWNFEAGADAAPARAAPSAAPARLHSGGARPGARSRVKMDAFGAGVLGVADTVTFGYLDEMGAGLDSLLLGKDYEEQLRKNRDLLQQAEEEHGGGYMTGQIVGGFVPLAGWAGRIKKLNDIRKGSKMLNGARGMMVGGAVSGALYGSGSADGDFGDRAIGALAMGMFGAGGGLVIGGGIIPAGGFLKNKAVAFLRHGKPQSLIADFAPNVFRREADEATEEALKQAKKDAGPLPSPNPNAGKVRAGEEKVVAPKTKNLFSGLDDDVVENGALLSTKELASDPSVARKAMQDRIGKMSSQEAVRIAERLQKAELEGMTVNDPHYRSLLGIDIEGTGIDPDTAMRAAELLEEATEAILEKAGQGRKTFKQIEAEFEKKFAGQLTDDQLDAAVDRYSHAVMDVRVADHVAMLASVQLAKAREVLLPELKKGTEGARDRLVDSVTNAVSLMTRSNFIKSQAGRALASLRMQGKLAFDDVADNVDELNTDAVRARVAESLNHLDEGDLAEMLARLRNPADAQRIIKTLVDPEEAKQVGAFLRVRRTMTAFIKSNLLTPASGVFNVVGAVLHDLYRNHWARTWAANAYEMAGEFEAAAAMRFEKQIADAVYWQTHVHGLKAMLNRMKWDHWTTVEKRGVLLGKDVSKVKQKKQDLLATGFRPAAIREFDLQARATVQDAGAFDAAMKGKEAQGGFAAIWAAAQRAGAVAAHQLDAAGTATAKIVSGGLDAWSTNMVMLKETYAQAARYAWQEGLERGIPADEMPKWASNRAKELAEMPPGELLKKVEQKLLNREEVDDALKFAMGLDQKVSKEAGVVAFMDGPQSGMGKSLAKVMDGADSVVGLGVVKGLLTPYINTPTRILETGLLKYTPWGHKLKEVQDILARGGPEAALERARMEMGTMVISVGVMLGATGAVTITNGGWENSANLDEASASRINLPGGGFVEFGRLDPFGLGMGIGGSIGQAIQAYQHHKQMGYEAQEAITAALAIGVLGIRDATLEKSYLTGLRDTLQAAFSHNESDPMKAINDFAVKKLGTLITAQVPGSGTMRLVADTIRGEAPEMQGIVDQLLRLVPVPDILPPKVDFFGEEVDGRVFGIALGDKKTGEGDWLRDELAKHGINLSDIEKRDRSGFDLTSDQLTELRRIRATEAYGKSGYGLRAALEELVNSAEFQNAPTKKARQEMFNDALDGLNKSAMEIMEERDPDYASKRIAHKSLAAYIADGISRREAERMAAEDATSLGLPDPGL